ELVEGALVTGHKPRDELSLALIIARQGVRSLRESIVNRPRCIASPVPARGFEPRLGDSKSPVLPLDDAGSSLALGAPVGIGPPKAAHDSATLRDWHPRRASGRQSSGRSAAKAALPRLGIRGAGRSRVKEPQSGLGAAVDGGRR